MIEQAMQGVTGDMTITPRVLVAQGGYSGVVTEAGTTQRDIVREGVVQIAVTFPYRRSG